MPIPCTVLGWLGGSLLVAAGLLVLRWSRHRYDGLGRRRAGPWISVGLLLLVGLGAFVPGALRVREQHRLERAASSLVGTTVTVHCQGLGGAFVDATAELGSVRFGADGVPERSTSIKRDQCRDLADYLRSDKRHPSRDEVVAVHVLTHESMHMSGIVVEAGAECAAVQRDERMSELLGAAPADARALAVRYWRSVYPYMPDGYRSGECRAGGAMDEHLADSPWDG